MLQTLFGNIYFAQIFNEPGGMEHSQKGWELASTFLGNNLQSTKIEYVGIRGENYQGDLALDDINISGCKVS